MKVSFNFTGNEARKLIIGLLLAEIVLTIIYLANIKLGKPLRIVSNWFDLDGETSIANWFSALQIFSIGLVFLIASQFQNYSRSFLVLISSGFIFLSMDEAVGIHERITELLKEFAWVPRFKGDHGIWIPIYLTIGLLFTLMSLKQVLRLWRQYKHGTLLLLIGVTIYLIGAVGLEIVSYQFLRRSAMRSFYYIEVAIEEFLEMAGMTLTLYGSILTILYNQKRNPPSLE